MRVATFYGPNEIVVGKREFTIDKNEAAIKVDACAVCGYDARVYRHGHKKVRYPIVLGHEICGKLVQTINTPNGILKDGTRIAVSPVIPCLDCIYCNNQQYNLCNNLREIGSSVDGGFAEYLKIPQSITKIGGLIPIPDNLSNEEAALLEPLACCLNGFSRLGSIEKGSSVAIIGDGPIGLIHLQLAKRLYNMKTAVIGKIPLRIKTAESLGADSVFMFDSATAGDVLDFMDGSTNLIIVATSSPEALSFATKIARKNSKINLFSGFSNGHSFSPDPNWLHYNQISITGSFSSTPYHLQEAARLAGEGKIDLSKLITNSYSLNEIRCALSDTEEFRGLRVVINKF